MTLRRIAGVAVTAGALAATLASAGPAAGEAAAGARSDGSLAGRLLVANPGMKDPRFSRTVIYLVRHDARGALGLIVNRPFKEIPISLLLRRLGLEGEGALGSILARYGGPVQPGSLFVLHTADFHGEGTEVIADGIALTTGPDVLRAISAGKGPRRALLLLSYSGWGPGQLEREIESGGWTVVRSDPGLIFGDDDETKWERALGRRVVDL